MALIALSAPTASRGSAPPRVWRPSHSLHRRSPTSTSRGPAPAVVWARSRLGIHDETNARLPLGPPSSPLGTRIVSRLVVARPPCRRLELSLRASAATLPPLALSSNGPACAAHESGRSQRLAGNDDDNGDRLASARWLRRTARSPRARLGGVRQWPGQSREARRRSTLGRRGAPVLLRLRGEKNPSRRARPARAAVVKEDPLPASWTPSKTWSRRDRAVARHPCQHTRHHPPTGGWGLRSVEAGVDCDCRNRFGGRNN